MTTSNLHEPSLARKMRELAQKKTDAGDLGLAYSLNVQADMFELAAANFQLGTGTAEGLLLSWRKARKLFMDAQKPTNGLPSSWS